jgi:hypothetical protein
MILAGIETETQRKLKAFLAGGDTPARRKEFVLAAFEHQLEVTNQAARKYDPHHLNLGIRFGALPPDDVMRLGRLFDVYSHNIYEYTPNRAWVAKLHRLTGKPLLIGEFHFGTPTRGQAPALMQVANEKERGIAYRYYVEPGGVHAVFRGSALVRLAGRVRYRAHGRRELQLRVHRCHRPRVG